MNQNRAILLSYQARQGRLAPQLGKLPNSRNAARLARGARITNCGTVALTDWDPLPIGPRVHRQLMVARARIQGMVIFDYMDRYEEAIAQLTTWVREGELVQNEYILEGADAAREGIKMLYEGKNDGKLLVRVD